MWLLFEFYLSTDIDNIKGYGKSLPVCLRAAELFRPYEAVQSQVSR